MTKEEFLKSQLRQDVPKTKEWRKLKKHLEIEHEKAVWAAVIDDKKPISDKILADYPNLAKELAKKK